MGGVPERLRMKSNKLYLHGIHPSQNMPPICALLKAPLQKRKRIRINMNRVENRKELSDLTNASDSTPDRPLKVTGRLSFDDMSPFDDQEEQEKKSQHVTTLEEI